MKKSLWLRFLALFFLLTAVSACASRPKLYPNPTLTSRGMAAGEADVNQCIKDADAFLNSTEGRKIAKSAGFGAVVGGAIGAVAGLFSGNVGRGAAEGAAMGGVGGGTTGALSPNDIKRNFVNKCLAEKGYEVIGWD